MCAETAERRPFGRRLATYLAYRRLRFERSRSRPIRSRRIARALREAEAYFRDHPRRRRLVEAFSRSISTGAEWSDYHLLHRYICARRPSRVLEFGSGVTSIVMADALAESAQAGPGGHLVSMENIPKYHEHVKTLVPPDLAGRVTFLCSPRVETTWRGDVWGFGYQNLPEGRFDLVFVDGPTEYRDEEARRLGIKGANVDLLFLIDRDPDAVMDVIVDRRFSSLEAYQSVLPRGTVRYDPVMDVGVLARLSGRLLRPDRRAARLRSGDAWALLNVPRA